MLLFVRRSNKDRWSLTLLIRAVTTFRNHFPDYLEKVRNGEDIALTSRGKIIARLMPPGGGREHARQQLAALRV